MVIGFIGLGNMATAMISGMLQKKLVLSNDILGAARTKETMERCEKEYGIRTADNATVAENADLLFLAVKPVYFPEVIAQIKDKVRENTVVISIAAGKTMEYIEGLFERKIKLIRCMPNTPAMVLEGCTAVVQGELVSDGEMEHVKKLLSSFGTVNEVPEKMMDVVVGVSGSSPAYVFMFIEAMADEAVLSGMPRKQAYQMAAQAVLGSAKMVLETGKHPGELKDMVCSPGGTTIEAVKVLEEMGLRAAVMDAMEACIDKSRNL
ncbi:MAG TPA: pyrroline-5-carboxylate reductase [Lachnospiraceae bacterium]|nr:pyrroline-5-carboxylate reductase [Lachnospiraceae bacterium]